LIFQTLDDKSECVGVYTDGKLSFDEIPENLTKTWKYSASIKDDKVEYAWIRCGGLSLQQVCPAELKEELDLVQSEFKAYLTAFRIAKIDLSELCFYDLVPENFLLQFCEVKNKITAYVFENYDKSESYDHLSKVHKLLHKIKHKSLNVNNANCVDLMVRSMDREKIKKLLNGSHFINYNLFGTITGRLATHPGSFPVLTMNKKYRKLIKPHNDWFLSLDYNGAEVRTALALGGHEQPDYDIHEWNMHNIFADCEVDREEAKVRFFAWLYNPKTEFSTDSVYNKDVILRKYYKNGFLETPFGRNIAVDRGRAFAYLNQSTTADITLDRAAEIDYILHDRDSFVSHVVHDEVVVDLKDKERDLVPLIKSVYENTILGKYKVNLKAGENYSELKELII